MRTASTRRVLIASMNGTWGGSLRLPGLLRRAGAQVTALVPAEAIVRASRHIDRWLPHTASDGSTFLDDLRAATADDNYDWIALLDDPTIMLTLLAAGRASEVEQDWFDRVLPVPRDRRHLLTHKAALAEAGLAGQLATPASAVCGSLVEVQSAARAIGFPVVLKTDQGFAGNGVRVATDPQQLAAEFANLAGRLPLVVQAFLSGRVGSNAVVFHHGRVLACFPSYKAIVFPAPFGPSCAREYCDLTPELLQIAVDVGNVTGFHGVGGIDWIEGQNGRPLALEFNPRALSTMHMGRRVGIDMPAALRAMLGGEHPSPPRPQQYAASGKLELLFPQQARRCVIYQEWWELRHWAIPGRGDVCWDEPRILLRQIAGFLGLARWQLLNVLKLKIRKMREFLSSPRAAREPGTQDARSRLAEPARQGMGAVSAFAADAPPLD